MTKLKQHYMNHRFARMKHWVTLLLCAAFVLGGALRAGEVRGDEQCADEQSTVKLHADELEWHRLPPLPDAIGFAGSYAGVSNGVLLVAGGANFPDGPPWEGHTKVWHDRVFALTSPDGDWQVCDTRMPRPSAYGVSFTVRDEVWLVGGGDADQHLNEVWRMHWTGDDVEFTRGPALPNRLAFMSGVKVGDNLYIAGGIERPQATKAMQAIWSLSMDHFLKGNEDSSENWRDADVEQLAWNELPPWPGPERMLAVMGSDERQVFLMSGVVLKPGADGKAQREAPYLRDVFSFDPEERTWRELLPIPRPAAAAANAIWIRDQLFVLGGDDGSRLNQPPQDHPGFGRTVQRFNVREGTWQVSEGIPPGASRVTLPVVSWRGGWVLPSGEKQPGVRSPAVYWIKPSTND